ncbi:Transcription initiation factor TFIID subunit 4 [Mycena venus]|uniref:Transcription initiation factor TFIID subunit 4 n=1 Tax=Mycena venus TaxID=2733690 RepID=A0A8H6Z1T4_9AGAR|nr:Transcription initiation factor TFIID subunit 4 [Mycena venus]
MSGPPSGIPAISAELWDSLIPIDADAADSEPDPTPTVVTTVPTTTTPSTPAASYQHYQPYSHYQHQPQPTFQSYQQYAPPQQNMARQAIANAQQANAGGFDTADVATLNDAIGSAGVDLRAEEESLQRSHQQPQSYGFSEDRSRKQPAKPYFDVAFLGSTMRTIASRHKVNSGVPEDCVNYLALALRARLQDLVTGMIDAARHRTSAQFDRPASLYEDGTAAWGILVRSDVAKQLAALEKVERDEEERLREVRERRDKAITDALTALLNGEDNVRIEIPGDDEMDVDGGARRRPKKQKAAVVSEEVGRKMTNAAANRAAGLTGKYTWLTMGNGAPRLRPVGAAAAAPPAEGATPPPRPYKPSNAVTAVPPPLPPDADHRTAITIRDAMFVIEKERGHGGGRGAARGWT